MKLKRIIKRLVKAVPAVVGIVGGTALGGPAGAIAGGAFGHAVTKSDRNKLRGALKGAGAGALYSAVAPTLYHALGGTPASSGFLASATGIRHPSLLHQLGIKSAPIAGGGLGLFGNGQAGLLEKGILGKGLLSGIPGADFLKSNFGGALKQLQGSNQPYYSEEGIGYDPYRYGESLVSHYQPAPLPIQENQQEVNPVQKRMINNVLENKNSSALEKLMQLLQILEQDESGKRTALQAQNIHHRDTSPQKVASSLRNISGGIFKKGGTVQGGRKRGSYVKGGYVKGNSGGQDDKVPTNIPEGSFVMDATSVSLYGDGNSENGAKKLRKDLKNMEHSFMKSPFLRNVPQSNNIKTIAAKVSPGELIIDRKYVDMAGRGSNKTGSKIFNEFRKNIRKHKGVKQFLPKKSKPFESYVGSVH